MVIKAAAVLSLCFLAISAEEQEEERRSSANLPVSVGGILLFLLCIIIYLFDRPKKKFVEFESFEV